LSPREKIPAETRALMDRFADQRLLIRDRRKDAEGHDVDVVEVAHEALLRQPPFSKWLEDDREFLVWSERLSQARAAFEANQRGLMADRELAIARSWMQTRAEHEIEPADQAFIRDSIAADDKRRAEEAAQARAKEIAELEDAEKRAKEQKEAASKLRRLAWVLAAVALGCNPDSPARLSRASKCPHSACRLRRRTRIMMPGLG
jgi:conflict system STAND superfamily ATPase